MTFISMCVILMPLRLSFPLIPTKEVILMTQSAAALYAGLQALGLSDTTIRRIKEVYAYTGTDEDEKYAQACLHCLLAGQVCRYLATQIGLGSAQRYALVTAAVIHDAPKRLEHIAKDAIVAQAPETEDALGLAMAVVAALMIGQFPDLAAELTTASLTGHSSIRTFREYNQPLEAEIMHVVDDLIAGANLVMLPERMNYLRTCGRYPALTEEHPDFLDGLSWLEGQEQLSVEILDKLAARTGFESGKALNRHLVDTFTPEQPAS